MMVRKKDIFLLDNLSSDVFHYQLQVGDSFGEMKKTLLI